VRTINSIALAYDTVQDRVLAVVNPGALASWSFWLTRRLVLEMLGRLPEALRQSSPVTEQSPAEYRDELAAFEREVALAKTQSAMSHTAGTVLQLNAGAAELATTLSLTNQRDWVRLDLKGERGGQVAGAFTRADLQRVLDMLEHEVVKAGWRVAPTAQSQADLMDSPARKRRAN
jgi:hypothetical protein